MKLLVFEKRQILDILVITTVSVTASILEMLFLIYAYGVISGDVTDQQLLSGLIDRFKLSNSTFVVLALVLLLCKLLIIFYTSVSCKKYATSLYNSAFLKFALLYRKTELDWNAFFSAHLNVVTNSIYRSMLSLCSALVYFTIFFCYIVSSISVDIFGTLILSLMLILGAMIPIFYAFRKVASKIVTRQNIQLNFVYTLRASGLYYFSGFRAINSISERYFDVVDKLKTTQAVQQFFTELPRYIFEVIFIMYMLFIVINNSGSGSNSGEVMLLVIRLLPIFSSIFSNFANIYTNRAALKLVSRVLNESKNQFVSKIDVVNSLSMYGVKLKHNEKIFTYPDYDFIFDSTVYHISGVSGSGKSTLLAALVGQRVIVDGSICVNGRSNLLDEFYKSIIFISSEFEMPDVLTIGELILEKPAGPYKNIEVHYTLFFPELFQRNISLLEFLNFTGHYVTNRFSAGQKQRLAHFLALFSGSKVLICDEGFCHIDDKLRRKIISFYVKNNVYRGIVLVAHDTEFLESIDVQEIHIGKSR